jgi:hypothetical protein
MPAPLTPRQEALLFRVIEVLEREPVNTLNPHRISQELAIPRQAVEAVLKLGAQRGIVLNLAENVFYTPKQVAEIQARVQDWSKGGPFSLSELREFLSTTRKYDAPLIDLFDEIGFTAGPASAKKVIGKPIDIAQ